MQYDVAIVTGWSDIGGSTESYVNLTNALNDKGISTILFGPHKYHLNKCESGLIDDVQKHTANNLIWHFAPFDINIADALKSENRILSCHEHSLNKIFLRYNVDEFNAFHFVSDGQKKYQLGYSPLGVAKERKIKVIPNILDPTLKVINPPAKKIGGVIGSIDRNKQTHVSIQKALEDGCELVRVFGKDTDVEYHCKKVVPLFKNPKVKYHGVVSDKNKIYSSITDVYHYSKLETWGYIKAECLHLNIPFHSNNDGKMVLTSTDDIINSWKEILI